MAKVDPLAGVPPERRIAILINNMIAHSRKVGKLRAEGKPDEQALTDEQYAAGRLMLEFRRCTRGSRA